MDITLKLGTDKFLKSQLTSADTLLKPLFNSDADHLLIKELTTSGQYRNLKGELDLSKDFLLLVYIKLNNEQMSIFEDKINYKYDEFVTGDDHPAIFQSRNDFRNYLLINSFKDDQALGEWKKDINQKLKNGLQKHSEEPLGYFSQAYQQEF